MKKIMNLALIAVVASIVMVSNVDAKRVMMKKESKQETVTTTQQIDAAAQALVDAAKKVEEAGTPGEKEEAKQDANEAAEALLATLHERTWTGDLVKGYTEEQMTNAALKLEELEVHKGRLEQKITGKEAELAGMLEKGWFWRTYAKEGKADDVKGVREELQRLKASLKKVNKGIADQTVITGKTYASAIRTGVKAMFVAATAGAAYALDKYGISKGTTVYMEPGMISKRLPTRESMAKRFTRTPKPGM